VPTLPGTAIPLAQIAVAANATSIANAVITDLRQPFSTDLLTVGQVGMFPAVVPWGFVTSGSVVKRLRYPRLFALVGTTWNTGGEATDSFRAGPVMADRVPLAAGNSYVLGAMGGSNNVTLTAAQSGLRAHTHDAVGGGSEYAFATGAFGSSGSGANASTPYNVADNPVTGGVSGGAQAATDAIDLRQPYVAFNFGLRA
jgi:microcystin-dependent protein